MNEVNEPKAQLEAVPLDCRVRGMQYEHDPCGIVSVHAQNGAYAGEIIMGDDGYYEFWPHQRGGYWPSWAMRDIADKVDSMNAEWDAKVRQEIAP